MAIIGERGERERSRDPGFSHPGDSG